MAIWKRVFRSNNPFGWPFQPEFAWGRLFYPTDGYHLTQRQFEVIKTAAESVGERGLLISVVEAETPSFPIATSESWQFQEFSYKQYLELPLVLENSIYSQHGNWGVLISHEMHALVSGTPAFVNSVSEQYSDWRDDILRLKKMWLNNPNADWLFEALGHTAN